jgi:type II secretory pathway pseudopilin PulG
MKKGISLIVLVITIVVSLILLSVVVFNFQDNDITSKANKVQFQHNAKTYQDAALMYVSKLKLDAASSNPGTTFVPPAVIALSNSSNVAGVPLKTNDINKFEIENGQFVYKTSAGFSDEEKTWLSEIGVKEETTP